MNSTFIYKMKCFSHILYLNAQNIVIHVVQVSASWKNSHVLWQRLAMNMMELNSRNAYAGFAQTKQDGLIT